MTDVDVSLSRAQVLAMDFGIEESVPFKHLVSFDRLFTEPSLAHKYYLADITPKDKGMPAVWTLRLNDHYFNDCFQNGIQKEFSSV